FFVDRGPPRRPRLTAPDALAFIYLVLAAQFESFKDPFIIMLTVPLSITGALLALWWSGRTLNQPRGNAGPKKEEPRRGDCRGSYALHRTHYRPDKIQPGA
ncbi:MAG: efflux RND transporter permease subunit, partial [Methyloceanibacter sp.]